MRTLAARMREISETDAMKTTIHRNWFREDEPTKTLSALFIEAADALEAKEAAAHDLYEALRELLDAGVLNPTGSERVAGAIQKARDALFAEQKRRLAKETD